MRRAHEKRNKIKEITEDDRYPLWSGGRQNTKGAVTRPPAKRQAALQEVREALDLQAEIEALDRAIRDEENLADRPKGAA